MKKTQSIEDQQFRKDFKERMTSRAKDIGLKQSEITKKTALPKSTVNGWFTGASMPSGLMLLELSRCLRCSVQWLLSGVGKPLADLNTVTFESVPGAWEQNNETKSEYIRVPKLEFSGATNQNQCRLITHSAILTDQSLAWITCTDNSSQPTINKDDTVFIDVSIKTIAVSGSYYALKYPAYFRIQQVHLNTDGSLAIVDTARNNTSNTPADTVDVVGMVMHRCGQLASH